MNRSLVPGHWQIRLRRRVRQGQTRVQIASIPVLQAVLGAGLAFLISQELLGHFAPIFAPITAWACLGFSADKDLRRVAEVAFGVALGVGLGDLVVHLIGSGVWQVMLVLGVSAIIARFLDGGVVVTTQAGVQSIVLVGLPVGALGGGAMGRWTDALVGGAVALVITALWPVDVRKRVRLLAQQVWAEFSSILADLAVGISQGEVPRMENALYFARASQPLLDGWVAAARSSVQLSKVSPQAYRSGGELSQNMQAAALADRAMRNARVLIRRSIPVVQSIGPEADLSRAVSQLAEGCDLLARDVGLGRRPDEAISTFMYVAELADPWKLGADSWQVQSLVMLLRSLVVDLLEASGVDPARARKILPPL